MANNNRNQVNQNNKGGNSSNKSGNKNTQTQKPKSGLPMRAGLDSKGYVNDPNHFFDDAEIAKQVSQLSMNNIIGAGPILGTYRMPTVIKVALNPSVGNSYNMYDADLSTHMPVNDPITSEQQNLPPTAPDTNSGINMAAMKLFTLINQKTGRTAVYQQCDVEMIQLSIGTIVGVIEAVRRAFGVRLYFQDRNRTFPNRLLTTMGIDAADFRRNYSQYRERMNAIIAMMQSIPIIDSIAFLHREEGLYKKIYVDSPSPLATMFYYVPNSFWRLHENISESGTYLEAVGTQFSTQVTTGAPLSNIVTQLEEAVTELFSSSSLQIVYADIKNAAATYNIPMHTLEFITDEYQTPIEYSTGASLQFHNLSIVGYPMTNSGASHDGITTVYARDNTEIKVTDGNNVYSDPDTGELIYNPVFNRPSQRVVCSASETKTCIDLLSSDWKIEDIIEATRFKCLESGYWCKFYQNAAGRMFMAIPSDYAVHMAIYDDLYTNYIYTHLYGGNMSQLGTTVLCDLSKVAWSPLLYFYSGGLNSECQGISGDMEWFMTFDYHWLNKFNRQAYMGLFKLRT